MKKRLTISFYTVYFHDAESNGRKPLQNFNGVVIAAHGNGAIGCGQSKGIYDELTRSNQKIGQRPRGQVRGI